VLLRQSAPVVVDERDQLLLLPLVALQAGREQARERSSPMAARVARALGSGVLSAVYPSAPPFSLRSWIPNQSALSGSVRS